MKSEEGREIGSALAAIDNSKRPLRTATRKAEAIMQAPAALPLMDEPEKIPVAGKVVWVTPKGAQGNRAAGIGVQFSDQDNTAITKIENYLAGMLNSDKPTHTM